jgi:hypothetical protein
MQSLSGKELKNSWMWKFNVQEVKAKCPGQNISSILRKTRQRWSKLARPKRYAECMIHRYGRAGMQNNKEIRHPSRGVSPIPACSAVGMMMSCRGSLSSCVPAHGDKLPANILYSTWR